MITIAAAPTPQSSSPAPFPVSEQPAPPVDVPVTICWRSRGLGLGLHVFQPKAGGLFRVHKAELSSPYSPVSQPLEIDDEEGMARELLTGNDLVSVCGKSVAPPPGEADCDTAAIFAAALQGHTFDGKRVSVVARVYPPSPQSRDAARVKFLVRRFCTLAAILDNPKEGINSAPIHFQKDKAFVMAAVEQNPLVWKFAQRNLKDDREFAAAVATKNGRVLQYMSASFKRDRGIVLAAVKEDGEALQFASKHLQNDRSVVSAAVRQSGWALEYASESLQDAADIVLAAVRQTCHALQFASAERQNDMEIVPVATRQEWTNLKAEYRALEVKFNKAVAETQAVDTASRKKIDAMEAVISKANADFEALSTTKAQLIANVDDLTADNVALTAQCELNKASIDRLVTEKKDSEDKYNSARADALAVGVASKGKIDAMEACIARLSKANATACEVHLLEKHRIEKYFRAAMAARSTSGANFATMKTKLNEVVAAAFAADNASKKHRAALEAKLAELSKANAVARADGDASKKELLQLKAESKKAKTAALAAEAASREKFEAMKAESDKANDATLAANASSRKKMEAMETMLSKANVANEAWSAANALLTAEVDDLTADNKMIESELNLSEQERKRGAERETRYLAEREKQKARYAKLELASSVFKKETKSRLEGQKAKLKDTHDRLKKSLSEAVTLKKLNAKLEKSNAKFEVANKRLVSRNAALMKTIATGRDKAKLKDAQNRLKQSLGEAAKLNRLNAKLEKSNAKFEDASKRLVSQNAALMKSLESEKTAQRELMSVTVVNVDTNKEECFTPHPQVRKKKKKRKNKKRKRLSIESVLHAQDKRVRVKVEQMQATIEECQETARVTQEEFSCTFECVICMNKARSAVFLPCNHMSCCSECAAAVRHDTNRCPLCRAEVISVVETFM